jgi:hypothetical protein
VERVFFSAIAKVYSGIDVGFAGSETSWSNIANKLEPDPARRADAELELQSLVQAATHDWDVSDSAAIRAQRLELRPLAGSGDNTVVLQMRPVSATGEAQAEVVLKISRIRARTERADRVDHDDHTQFNHYKNVIGGFGLRNAGMRDAVISRARSMRSRDFPSKKPRPLGVLSNEADDADGCAADDQHHSSRRCGRSMGLLSGVRRSAVARLLRDPGERAQASGGDPLS